MAWRTSEAKVKGVLGGNYDSDASPSLAPFIDTANVQTDQVVTCAAAKNITHSAAILERIETWLAAHFYAHSDQLYESKKTGGASGRFQGKTDMGLDSTQYGQTAKMFDTSGCLNQFSLGKRAGMVWLGKPRSEETEYVDRD